MISGSCENNDSGKKPDNWVFVLGLDGFTWDLAIPWMKDGTLPNLKKFTEENVWDSLQSVPPYNSPAAWGSAVTGVNPGKHGVYSFFQNKQLRNDFSKKKVYFINSYNYQVPFLWDILSGNDYKMVVLNVPGSSPPQPLNGIMIAGQPYYEDAPVTYPKSLLNKLKHFKKEQFTSYCEEGLEDEWLKECYEIERGRVETMFQLMKYKKWDLFWAVLTSPDRVQHHFWKFMDPRHPHYDKSRAEKYGDEIKKIYGYMDEVVGRLLKELPNGAVLIILSDHGFGPVYKSINVADFLFGDENLTSIPARMIKVNYNIYFGGAVNINMKIRENNGDVSTDEYEKIRNYLINKLENLKDPETGLTVIDKIYKREEIFSGSYSFMAPDIFCVEKPTYLFSGIKVNPDGNMIEPFPSFAISGSHHPPGVLAMGGGPIKRNVKMTDSQIADITPTILYLMGMPIPEYMDGKVLHKSIHPVYLNKYPPKIKQLDTTTDKQLLDQLRKLGYIK